MAKRNPSTVINDFARFSTVFDFSSPLPLVQTSVIRRAVRKRRSQTYF